MPATDLAVHFQKIEHSLEQFDFQPACTSRNVPDGRPMRLQNRRPS
ncbi:hypothetical protein RRSWK_02829 [Rhodopirellula sp. SWK7]|nr:hypothetical protein RRSWK_02829 [Rhodopirellula sp. SWK7]